jgi:peptidoglycan/xylan/chitin deacetylase (PgdA/CDA1 family)
MRNSEIMIRDLRRATLAGLASAGAFERARTSRWRRERLLILCYHGVSIEDEHEWRPRLYMRPQCLAQRFDLLRERGYAVLPLAAALERLYENDLPPGSVALTFDDGGYDFYKSAYPLLQRYQLPATVYQTTYYADFPKPVFNLICSYMLWKRRGSVLGAGSKVPVRQRMDLRTEEGRQSVVSELMTLAAKENLSGREKHEIARRLAEFLEIEWESLLGKRILHIMSPREIAEVSAGGMSVQLHTHRHRTPLEEELFRQEISENRKRIEEITGSAATDFCYPLGNYERQFLGWLRLEGVRSAVTCDPALAASDSHPLLLPRLVDASAQSLTEFEAWLSGMGHLLSRRGKRRHIPQAALDYQGGRLGFRSAQ